MTDRHPKTAARPSAASLGAGGAPVAQLLQSAVAMHRAGRLDEALALYRKVLAVQPTHPDAVCLEGTVLLQRGDLDAARARLEEATRLGPENPDAHNNYGNALRKLGQTETAIAAFRQALDLRPRFAEAWNNLGSALATVGEPAEAEAAFREALGTDPGYGPAAFNLSRLLQMHGRDDEAIACLDALVANGTASPDIHNQLGVLHQRSGHVDAAEQSYRKAIQQNPRHAKAHNNLGTLLQAMNRREDALACYRTAVALDPGYTAAQRNLGLLLQALGQWQAATRVMEDLRAADPDDPIARHVLAALRGETTPAAPRAYLQSMFDNFAPTFEQHLTEVLKYRAPQQLRDSLDAYSAETAAGRRFARVLDMGCGTGLVARAVQDIGDEIVGIDLAPRMAAAARASGLYAAVHECTLDDYFMTTAAAPERFDLVLCADLFIYIGDVAGIVRAVAGRLTADGLFAFSVEHCEGADYELRQTGRYAQSQPYLTRLAHDSGLRVVRVDPVVLREEKGQPVDGRVYVLSRHAPGPDG